MKKFIITYDLKTTVKDYTAVNNIIMTYKDNIRISTTTFIIITDDSAQVIFNKIIIPMNANKDVLFISKLNADNHWRIQDPEVRAWLKQHHP